MYRKFLQKLIGWQDNKQKEPLLIIGPRQVGKTWIIRYFAKSTFENSLYINLEEQPEYISVFEDTLKPEKIFQRLQVLSGKHLDPEKCLIIIDEIQKSEKAITSLKYFCESDVPYRVIGAGSLLGVKLERFHSSFPVGKVSILKMYPMDFEEFLLACSEDLLRDAIVDAYQRKTALPDAIHKKAIGLYQDYLFVGGMPQAVNDYIANGKDVTKFHRDIQNNLLLAYSADMSKYTISAAESMKISQIYHSVPGQLAKENPKFKYKEVRAGFGKRALESSLDWLMASGMVIPCTKIKLPQPPLKAYKEEGNFKIYLSDVGLLSAMSGIQYRDILPETANIFKGAITENYVVQALHTNGFENFYYKPDQTIEVDQVIELDGEIIPIEIKSGRHKRSKSLKNYINKYRPKIAIRLSDLNFGMSEELFSVPLYAAFCIK